MVFVFARRVSLEFSGIIVYNPYSVMDLLKEGGFLMVEKEFDIQGEVLDRYSNFVHISSSFFDFTLRFGLVEDLKSEQNKLTVSNVTRIFLSPQHAKVLYKILKQQLDEYEKRFGEIKLPKEE